MQCFTIDGALGPIITQQCQTSYNDTEVEYFISSTLLHENDIDIWTINLIIAICDYIQNLSFGSKYSTQAFCL